MKYTLFEWAYACFGKRWICEHGRAMPDELLSQDCTDECKRGPV